MDRAAIRANEIAQGLREESGCLTFSLDVIDYGQGHADFEAGTPPPRVTSPSYDLGRNRASEKAEAAAEVADWMAREDARRDASMADLLKDRPDVLAEYRANIAAIRNPVTPSP